jgi:flagellar hook-associated protein 2
MVENYNKFRDKLAELTAFDTQSNKRSLLTGDATALRLDMDLSRLFSGRFTSDGAIQSLGQLGVSLTDDGKLELDETRLKEAYADNPEAVQRFFAAADTGFSARLGKLLEQAAGEDGSLLARRLEAVQNKVRQNEQRLADMQKSLDKQRTRLLMQFYNMELAIAKLKDNLTALDSVKPLSLYSTGSQSSG